MSYLLPFLGVILGGLLVIFTKKGHISSQWPIKLLLSFSGAFLLSLTLFNLLPDVYHHLEGKATGVFIMLGITLQIVLETLSKGAEHGHIHHHGKSGDFPWLLFISLCIHSFLEGFPLHQHNSMMFGVLMHKIPIAILITAFLVKSEFKMLQILLFLLVFAIMTPLGTFVSFYFEGLEAYISYINAIVIGIFLHISTIILFESDQGHKFNFSKLFAIILGIIIAYFI
jgi:zinc transporter ZupT